MEPILENYSMEIIESTILGLRQRIEGYKNDIQENELQLQLHLKRQNELQSGLEQLEQELKVQERKKREEESPTGQERRRLEEAKRQYIEEKRLQREEKIEGLALQSGPIQRLGLRSRTSLGSPGKEAKMTDTSGIQRLNAHGPHFARKFNTFISGFSSEDSAREKMKTDGGKKHKTRKTLKR